jgi:hypothetical protein
VDVSLEVDRVPSRPNRRKVTGLARLVDMPEFIYEMTDEGMKYIGETADADLDALKVRLFGVTPIGTKEWATKRELIEAAGEPTPSPTQADSALGLLVEAGEVEREPKETKPGATYRYRRPM